MKLFSSILFFLIAGMCAFAQPGERLPADSVPDVRVRHDTLSESRITAWRERKENRTQTGLMKLDSQWLNRGFAFMSTPDLIKSLQMLPGVTAGTELMSGLYVHGGTGSDNLFLLNDVPLYQVSHFAGLFSSFNTELVEGLDFYKSGFPARFGGRLSSVVDVKTKTGDMEDYHGTFSLGLIDGNISVSGPIIKGRTSFYLGLRRTLLDVVTAPMIAMEKNMSIYEDDTSMSYAFWDANAGITHLIDNDNSLALNFYMGRDDLGITSRSIESSEMEVITRWGNILTSISWDSRLSSDIYSKIVLFHSNNLSRIGFGLDETIEGTRTCTEMANITLVNDFGLKADFDWFPLPSHHMRFGGSYQYHTYTPERYDRMNVSGNGPDFHYDDTEEGNYYGHETALYIEDEILLWDCLGVNAGMRYVLFGVTGKVYNVLEPRVAMSYRCAPWLDIKASYTDMNQFNHQLASNYMDLPTNTWMPVTEKIGPMHSRQVAGGLYFNLPHHLVLNLEGYYKTMDNLQEYTGTNTFYPPLNEWEYSFSSGLGRAYGMEVEFAWRTPTTDLSAFYTLSWNERFFEDIYPKWYPDRNDHRHKITLMANHRFSKGFEIYAAWNWQSGRRFTASSHVVSHVYDDGSVSYDFYNTSPNNLKMPPYHRLDIGMNFRKKTSKGNENVWNISVYNAYCRMNPIMAMVEEKKDGTFEGVGIAVIPIIPSFSYTYRF